MSVNLVLSDGNSESLQIFGLKKNYMLFSDVFRNPVVSSNTMQCI